MSNKLRHFLRRLISHYVTVILKDDTAVQGKLCAVDSTMNVHLRGVSTISKNGIKQEAETYTIRGNQILWIEFPDSINTDYLI